MSKKIIMLASAGASTNCMFNGVEKDFLISNIIMEEPVNKKIFLKKRIKKLGFFTVVGQILFQLLIIPLLHLFSKKRIEQISEEYQLDSSNIDKNKIILVKSVNSDKCLKKIKELNPDIIIVNGTRIISKKILNSTSAIFVNTHVGVTPEYRGVHGAYWAIDNKDVDNCGVTVHLIDEGIDTGSILYQKKIKVTKNDNFTTYPFSQIGEGINLIKKVIIDVENKNLKPYNKSKNNSKLWSHPTIWYYIYKRVFFGVK